MENKFVLINLNKTVSNAELQELQQERKKWIIFTVITMLMVALAFWFISINSQANFIISERNNVINKLIQDTENLKNEGQINLSKRDINNLIKTEGERIIWSEKLKILSDITPVDMAITGLEFKNLKFTIKGISKVHEDEKEFLIVEQFINMLKTNARFSDDFKTIKFKGSERDLSRGQEIFKFTIEAELNKKSKRKLRRKK
ncbi:MAG: hypothetical protein VX770_00285 [Candidatus Neomarinimicrobiota bacterium]|nr:hypothetical protein [Candidatus Neomarinimicrobiota bacterium]